MGKLSKTAKFGDQYIGTPAFPTREEAEDFATKAFRITIEQTADQPETIKCFKCGHPINPLTPTTTKSWICQACGQVQELRKGYEQSGPNPFRHTVNKPAGTDIGSVNYPYNSWVVQSQEALNPAYSGAYVGAAPTDALTHETNSRGEHNAEVCRACLRESTVRRWNPSKIAQANQERMKKLMAENSGLKALLKAWYDDKTNPRVNSLLHKQGLDHSTEYCPECEHGEKFVRSTIAY